MPHLTRHLNGWLQRQAQSSWTTMKLLAQVQFRTFRVYLGVATIWRRQLFTIFGCQGILISVCFKRRP